MVFNTIVKSFVRVLSKYEHHSTQTAKDLNTAVKLTLLRFLNGLIPILIYNDTGKWYNHGDLVVTATFNMVLNGYLEPFMLFMNPKGNFSRFKFWCKKDSQLDKVTQKELNLLATGNDIDTPNIISNFFSMIMLSLVYSMLIPQSIFFAAGSSFFYYWATKYNLLRIYKLPDSLSREMSFMFSRVLTKSIAIIMSVASWWFLTQMKEYEVEQQVKDEDRIFTNDSMRPIIVALGISVFMIVYAFGKPKRDPLKVLDSEEKYQDHAITFLSDYDRSNPLTYLKGRERFLEMQKKHLEKEQDGSAEKSQKCT